MSNVKERIMGAVTIMSDQEAEKVWNMIQGVYKLYNAEEVSPEPNEISAFHAYQSGDPEYQPSYSQDDKRTWIIISFLSECIGTRLFHLRHHNMWQNSGQMRDRHSVIRHRNPLLHCAVNA